MLNNKNVLVNGCSFSRGPGSWPYHLQNLYNFTLVNLAQLAAGNTYIHESTVSELAKRKYDCVIIMWSGLSRIDFKVENISLFTDTNSNFYTSHYTKTRNDWKGKQIFPINDQDYVEDNWIFGVGPTSVRLIERGPFRGPLAKTEIFNGLYRYIGINQFIYHSLQKMISLQSFLKSQNIPYLFTFYQDYAHDLRLVPELYNLLDQTNIYNEQNIFDIANKYNDVDETFHPKTLTHSKWAGLLKEFIDAKNS